MTARETVSAWLSLARIGNLPTVWSNVLVGVVLARGGVIHRDAAVGLAAAVAIASALYIAGMFLNDFADRDLDRHERPERPLPSGRISGRSALFAAIGLITGACAIALTRSPICLAWTAGLAAAIVAYDALHKRFASSLVLMGVCRALVYPVAASAVGGLPAVATPAIATCAFTLGLYTVLLTFGARHEAKGRGSRLVAILLPVLAMVPLAALVPPAPTMLAILTGAGLIGWLGAAAIRTWRHPDRIVPTIHGWIAGIAWLDAWMLSLIDGAWPVAAALACFVVTVLGQRRIVGT